MGNPESPEALMTKQKADVLEFLRSFIAGGVNQDFKPWARELYEKLYRDADEPTTNDVTWLRGLMDRLAYPERYPESGSGSWHSGDGPFEEWASRIAEEYKKGAAEPTGGPADFVGALQDKVHEDAGPFRAGRSVRSEPRAPHEHRWVLPSPPLAATATNYFCGDCGFFPGPPVERPTESSGKAPIVRTVVDCPDLKDTCRRNCTTECLRLSENRNGDGQ